MIDERHYKLVSKDFELKTNVFWNIHCKYLCWVINWNINNINNFLGLLTTRAVDGFLRMDFLGVHGDVTLGYPTTMNEFTLFMDVMPNPFIQDMFWLGWNFYRRINLHCRAAFHTKGGSRLFDRANPWSGRCITAYALNKLAIQNSKCQWKGRLFVCPDLAHWQQKCLMARE